LRSRRTARAKTERRRTLVRAAIQSLDEALTYFADDATTLRISNGGASASRAYLVPERAQQDFVGAAETVAAELDEAGCSARLIGPMPAYSFADIELGSPAA
jgi:hypothetical protein